MENTQIQGALRYCLYARKSTESDEKQAMSIDSQVKEMLSLAQRDGLKVTEIKWEAHSAKATGQRPVFNEMLQEIRNGRYNSILTWAPDRLSRNAGDLGAIVDLLDQKVVVEIRTFSQKFTNNPNEKFLLMILGAQGKLENDQKGVNVKRGLRARCEMGLWPAPAPTGYANERRTDRKGYVMIDPNRAPIIKQMFEKVAYEKWSGRKVFRWLNEIGFTTPTGKKIWLSNVYKILSTPFYYGEFEYPLKSGTWYQGRHEPIISKELYMEAQKVLRSEQDLKYENKEFAFTKLIKCGKCGSGITADEKFKKLKDGTVNKYIYYGCTRSRNINCKNGYLREEELIQQLINIIDQVNIDELGLRERLKEEAERVNKFQSIIGGQKQKIEVIDIDMKNYAKYLLQDGSIFEKRQLLSHLKDRLIIREKVVVLA
jgi:site-specific DNA recombinase